METTAPIIALAAAEMWVHPGTDTPVGPAEVAEARHLGLTLGVLIALACDAVGILLAVASNPALLLSPSGGLSDLLVAMVVGTVPVLAAAPVGWLVGPQVARSEPLGSVGAAVLLAIGTMLVGDVIVSSIWTLGAIASQRGGEATAAVDLLVTLIILGAIVVGPLVIAFSTLPAAVVWVVAFRVVWRRRVGVTRRS